MRLAGLLLVALVGLAVADVHKYDGQIIISPDPVPSSSDELDVFVKANVTKDGHYDLIKGPPWDINLVGLLAKEPSAAVTLEFVDAGKPLQAIELTAKRRMVIAHTQATVAAGFAAGKTYVVQLRLGKTVLAKAELTLRS